MFNEAKSQNYRDTLNIIEEKIGNTNILFSEVFNLYLKRIREEKKKELFTDNDSITLDISEKNKFAIKGPLKYLYYENEMVHSPIYISFEKSGKVQIYKIYTQKYLNEIYINSHFKDPMILIGNSLLKYDPEEMHLFSIYNENKDYKIFDKKEENYEDFYSETLLLDEDCEPSVLTPNFKYYFSSPKAKCKMNFSLSQLRCDIIFSLLDFSKKEKIHSIYGPYGSGKTTSLIIAARTTDNVCYLNLNALNQNKDKLDIWKYQLFLKELYHIFKINKEESKEDSIEENKDKKKEEKKHETTNKNKKYFELIKEQIYKSNHYWEAISLSIKFCIQNKIKSIFILDQYKEEFDKDFSEFIKIKNQINNLNNEYVNLIVSSSTNNSDIREFIIKKYIDKYSEDYFINNYQYVQTMFKLTDIKDMMNDISPKKKNVIDEYFSNIPIFFYKIYDSEEEEINKTVNNIRKEIIDDIEKFYILNQISYENLAYIIKNYNKIESNFSKEKEIKKDVQDNNLIKTFIKILPIKYLTFEFENDSIVKISFYFKLAKLCLLDFIFQKIYKLFEQPNLQIPERTIGDLLELIVIEYLKNNDKEKIDQVCEVDSIWEMKRAEGFDQSKVNSNNILITQTIEEAKLVDFAFLLKGKVLILAQCKKALSQIPKEYITINKIKHHKNYLKESFKNYFGCDIKKIKLFYLTGIYFTDKEKNLYHTWSKKDQTFKALENITQNDHIPLVFFDVENKNLLLKNNLGQDSFDSCTITSTESLICNEDIYDYVKLISDKEEFSLLFRGIKNITENKEIELEEKYEKEYKSDNKINIELYEASLDKEIDKEIDKDKNRIVSKEGDSIFLNNNEENLLTTFKLLGKQCFSYYDTMTKKMKFKRIKNGEAKDFDFKEFKFYYLKNKTKGAKKKNK